MRILCLIFLFAFPILARAQDSSSVYNKLYNLPDKFFGSVNSKSGKFQQHLIRSTTKYLKKLSRQELKLQRKLAKKDSLAAKELFGDVNKRYDSLLNVLHSPGGKLRNIYSSRVDSVQTALNFFNKNNILGQSPAMQSKLQSAFKDYGDVQQKFKQANFIQEQLKQRQQMLKQRLQNVGLAKEFRKYQEKVYYYRAQVDEYKNMFETPGKMEAALLKVANKIPAFSQFFNKHSQLASLFRLPGNDDPAMESIEGLQTRAMVRKDLEQRLGSGPSAEQYMSQNIANAQAGLDKAKNKLNQLGNAGSDMDMPNFKADQQKTKSFFNRLELNTNVQSTKGNSFLPVSTDFGLSLGYRISSKSIIGIGSSYRMGWGKDIRHIAISHEGVGLRTFYEMKLKGTIWITGGGEMNYRSKFNQLEELKDYNAWQQSALTGISKKYKFGKKFKGNVQLLYDFLHYRNVPRTQPVIFRTGFNLK
ncbi:MAG: hypothetical protein E6Q24_05160 [Chitinophagaceae bacterium]|nr:MAG: hypothetical protein E6Q24_05160 [Chitinophagaceae bacterium]